MPVTFYRHFGFLAFSLMVIFTGCKPKDPNKQIDEGKVQGEIYESKELGWTITIPQGWDVVDKGDNASRDQKGREAIEQSSGVKIDESSLKHLISFQKNKFNIFLSTSEPFKEESPGDYEAKNHQVAKMIFDAYVGKGIKADTSTGKEIISGLDFYTFYAKIYGSDGKIILNQVLYSRLINGHDFGVSINYNNDKDKNDMLNAFKQSTFK